MKAILSLFAILGAVLLGACGGGTSPTGTTTPEPPVPIEQAETVTWGTSMPLPGGATLTVAKPVLDTDFNMIKAVVTVRASDQPVSMVDLDLAFTYIHADGGREGRQTWPTDEVIQPGQYSTWEGLWLTGNDATGVSLEVYLGGVLAATYT